MIWLITGVICFFLFKRFISRFEVRNYAEWEPIKFPLYIWVLIVLCCFTPVMNFIALICVEAFIVGDTKSNYADFRFKKGQDNHWINKLIDIMSKKY